MHVTNREYRQLQTYYRALSESRERIMLARSTERLIWICVLLISLLTNLYFATH